MDTQALDGIARRHGVRLLLEFGSHVTGQTHARSDVDLAVLLEDGSPSFEARARLEADLQALYPGRSVDLVVLNRADPLLLKQVAEGCRLVHGPARRLHELRMYAFRRYQDHRRYLALEREYVRRTLAGSLTP